MNKPRFEQWCQDATAGIRYKPDRKAVAAELQAHLEDHYDALRANGLSQLEAKVGALKAMGSAEEIAPQLAAIHRPWLGYLFSLVRFAAIATAILAIFLWGSIAGSFLSSFFGARNFDSILVNYGPLDYYCYPNVSDRSDGLHFQITEAGYNVSASELYFELRVLHWPWMRYNGVYENLWAMDSNGNYYAPRAEAPYEDVPKVTSGGYSISNCITHMNMEIKHFDCDAEWIELHYNRDGRDVVLRIDLTGGDRQ